MRVLVVSLKDVAERPPLHAVAALARKSLLIIDCAPVEAIVVAWLVGLRSNVRAV